MRRRAASVLVLMVLASPLVACSVPVPSSGDLTLDQAKSEVREAEDDILALVPADVVTETLPRPETSAVLFECTAPGTYYWPGGAQLRIDASADSGAIIGEIHDAWTGRTDWDVTWKKRGEDGVFHLDLLRDDGLHLAVANLESNTILNVSSFSPCFALDDYDPNSSY